MQPSTISSVIRGHDCDEGLQRLDMISWDVQNNKDVSGGLHMLYRIQFPWCTWEILTALEKAREPTPRSNVPKPTTCRVDRLTLSQIRTWGCSAWMHRQTVVIITIVIISIVYFVSWAYSCCSHLFTCLHYSIKLHCIKTINRVHLCNFHTSI